MFIQMRRTLLQLTRDSSPICEFHAFFSTCNRKQQTNTSSFSELLVHKYQFSLQLASRVASVTKKPKSSDSILSFFKEVGFSNTQLEKVVKYRPIFLLSDLEKIFKPKIKLFQDLGFSADDIAKIITTDPSILHCSVDNRLIPSLSTLKGLLGSDEGVAKILRTSGSLLTRDLEKTLVPNVKFLESCGVSMDQILKVIYCFPRFFLLKPEVVRKFVDKADELGVNRSSKQFFYAVRTVSSMTNKNWELKMRAFRDMGFSENDILRMFRYSPSVFAMSGKKLKKVKEVLIATGKYDISCIVNTPVSLCCSIENRYIPRFRVLGILESKKLITNWPCLSTLQSFTDKRFFEKFVSPYLDEIGDVYKAKSELDSK
ncbi:hypothetical protein ACJIZ3_003208 [Penstemon smallii]|uniref:Uncharacterized protein n=1 Tax=Penstemon smallii TaxID=265156 RepID=A0ABD3UA08_9LAMI